MNSAMSGLASNWVGSISGRLLSSHVINACRLACHVQWCPRCDLYPRHDPDRNWPDGLSGRCGRGLAAQTAARVRRRGAGVDHGRRLRGGDHRTTAQPVVRRSIEEGTSLEARDVRWRGATGFESLIELRGWQRIDELASGCRGRAGDEALQDTVAPLAIESVPRG